MKNTRGYIERGMGGEWKERREGDKKEGGEGVTGREGEEEEEERRWGNSIGKEVKR